MLEMINFWCRSFQMADLSHFSFFHIAADKHLSECSSSFDQYSESPEASVYMKVTKYTTYRNRFEA